LEGLEYSSTRELFLQKEEEQGMAGAVRRYGEFAMTYCGSKEPNDLW
jgi:hypothetical protein